MNLMTKSGKADYVITGQWAKKAHAEAARYGQANVVASSADKTFTYIPKLDPSTFTKDADYFYICMNNTIYGNVYHELPDTGDVPLVADISSCILSRPIDVSKFGVLYAGAQKNMAPAGLTVVIVREDLIGNAMDITPTMLNWKTHADNGSMFNTPPCYTIYIAKGTVVPEDRSLMNVPFVTGDADLDAKFVKEATENGLVNIKGHRTVGGMRASIYNAMPYEGVEKLVEFMKKFEAENK